MKPRRKPKSDRTFFFLLRGNTKGRETYSLDWGGTAGTSPQNLAQNDAQTLRRASHLPCRGTCSTQRPQRHCPVAAPGSPQNSTDLETAGFFFLGGGLGEGVKNRTSVNKGVRRGRALNILTTDKAWGSFTVLLCSILLLSYLQISFFLFSLFVELLIILIEFNSGVWAGTS